MGCSTLFFDRLLEQIYIEGIRHYLMTIVAVIQTILMMMMMRTTTMIVMMIVIIAFQ